MKKHTHPKVLEYTCYLFMLMLGLQLAGYQYCLIYITAEFALDNTAMGLLSSMQFLPTLIIPLVFGGLVDKFNKRVITAVCVLAYAVGSVCVLFSDSVGVLAVGIAIMAAGGAIPPSSIPTMLSEMDPPNSNRYANMGEMFFSLGYVAAPLGMAWLTGQGVHWSSLYIIVGACTGVIALALLLMRPAAQMAMHRVTDAAEGGKPRLGLIAMMLILFALFYNCIEPGFMTFASSYFTEVVGDAAGASISIAAIGACMVGSRMVASRFRGSKEKLMMIGALGASLSALLMAFLPIKGVSVAWCALFGLIAGPCWPLMMSVAIETHPGSAGRVTTLIMAGSGIGGTLVAPLMGMVSDAAGIALSYIVPAAAALLCALVIFVVYRKRKGEAAASEA